MPATGIISAKHCAATFPLLSPPSKIANFGPHLGTSKCPPLGTQWDWNHFALKFGTNGDSPGIPSQDFYFPLHFRFSRLSRLSRKLGTFRFSTKIRTTIYKLIAEHLYVQVQGLCREGAWDTPPPKLCPPRVTFCSENNYSYRQNWRPPKLKIIQGANMWSPKWMGHTNRSCAQSSISPLTVLKKKLSTQGNILSHL